MSFATFGKKTVTTAGTIVQVTTTVTNCNAIYFQALTTNTGKIFIGLSTLVASTLVGCLRVLAPPIASPATYDSWNPQSRAPAPFDLSTIWLDASVSGEGVLISYLLL